MRKFLTVAALTGRLLLATTHGHTLESLPQADWAQKVSTERAYLKDLLTHLNIPEASQTLVFSKTSHQIAKISPQWPRAIYFNEDFYVGYVREGLLEIIEMDPQEGAKFYTLERPNHAGHAPVLVEDASCVSCHEAHHAFEVPGLMVRSVYPDAAGQPLLRLGTYRTTTTSPLSERWGGWWVTGGLQTEAHLGNRVFESEGKGALLNLKAEVDTSLYLSPGSDVLALMILEHQSEFHNVVSQCRRDVLEAQQRDATWRAVTKDPTAINPIFQGLLEDRAKRLLKVVLFAHEAELPEEGIQGDVAFETAFLSKSVPSASGRSLRDLQLHDRLFKYRCSYMIYTESFKQLPEVLLQAFSQQLQQALEGKHPEIQHLAKSERARIREILLETAPFLKFSEMP